MNEMTSYDEAREVAAPRATSITPADRLSMMREAMTNPAVDPGKARSMLALLREMENDERQAQFNQDKGRAIRAMPAIFKKGRNTHTDTRYAKFEDMHRAVMPVLSRHNLTLDFRIGYEGNQITVQPILRHDNGFIEEGGTMRGPADEGKGRSAIQAIGSASSYLKRYSMRAMLNLIEDGEDDDGLGVARPDFQLNDRQQALIVDAQMAAERGEYNDWFRQLPTRDRAVLINNGTHARHGGLPILAAPGGRQTGATVDNDAPAAGKTNDTPPTGQETPDEEARRLAEEWLARYEADVDSAIDREQLAEFQRRANRAIEKMKVQHADLHKKVIEANSAALARLDGEDQ